MYASIPLVVELFEHKNFQGKKLVLITDVRNLHDFGFGDKVSSVKVFGGPNFNPVANQRVRLAEHRNFGGRPVDIAGVAGSVSIPDIHDSPFGFGEKVSSVQFL